MLYLLPSFTICLCLLALLLGACVGSFLHCMVWRILHQESPWKGRSHCDFCNHELGVRDLFPIFSYLFSKGRCRYCGQKLSSSHLWAEGTSAIVFVTILLRYDISLDTLKYFLFAGVLISCSISDLYDYTIPDTFLLFGGIVWLVFLFFRDNILQTLFQSLLGGPVLGGVLLGIVLLYEKIKKCDAMGGGDIKLLILTGLFLGPSKNILCLLLACLLGIVFGLISLRNQNEATGEEKENSESNNKIFPWGPSIAAAAWLSLLGGDWFINLYLGMF